MIRKLATTSLFALPPAMLTVIVLFEKGGFYAASIGLIVFLAVHFSVAFIELEGMPPRDTR